MLGQYLGLSRSRLTLFRHQILVAFALQFFQLRRHLLIVALMSEHRPGGACRLVGTRLSCLRFLSHLHSPSGHYDEPEILSYAIPLVCSIGADVKQFRVNDTGSDFFLNALDKRQEFRPRFDEIIDIDPAPEIAEMINQMRVLAEEIFAGV